MFYDPRYNLNEVEISVEEVVSMGTLFNTNRHHENVITLTNVTANDNMNDGLMTFTEKAKEQCFTGLVQGTGMKNLLVREIAGSLYRRAWKGRQAIGCNGRVLIGHYKSIAQCGYVIVPGSIRPVRGDNCMPEFMADSIKINSKVEQNAKIIAKCIYEFIAFLLIVAAFVSLNAIFVNLKVRYEAYNERMLEDIRNIRRLVYRDEIKVNYKWDVNCNIYRLYGALVAIGIVAITSGIIYAIRKWIKVKRSAKAEAIEKHGKIETIAKGIGYTVLVYVFVEVILFVILLLALILFWVFRGIPVNPPGPILPPN